MYTKSVITMLPSRSWNSRLLSGGRRVKILGLLAGVALTAAACGSNSASPAATSGSTTSTTSGSSTTSISGAGTATVKAATVGTLGKILVDAKGFTLYRYTPDKPPTLACTGGCASAWPPLTIPTGSTPSGISGLSTIARGNALQVMFKNEPLYTFSGDTKPGQANGQGSGGVWFVVKANVTLASNGGETTTTTGGGGW
jgi:predicted lipoprotein with Yx(FWY)xxD motif